MVPDSCLFYSKERAAQPGLVEAMSDRHHFQSSDLAGAGGQHKSETKQSCFRGFGGVKVPRRTPGEGVVWCRGPAKDLDSPTMIPQALTNPISFFRATPPPPELASASGLVSDPRSGWFFEVLFRCRVPFSIFLRRVPTTKS